MLLQSPIDLSVEHVRDEIKLTNLVIELLKID
jgi:hypothetical protein